MGFNLEGNGLATKKDVDALGRTVRVERGYVDPLNPGNDIPEPMSSTSYQLSGTNQTLATTTLEGTSHTSYDRAGRKRSSTSKNGLTTQSKTLMLNGGGRLELTSLPRSGQDNRHRITSSEYTADGQLRRTRTYASNNPFATDPDPGTTVSHTLYEQGHDSKGRYKQTTRIANLFDRRITRTYLDAQGRQKEIIHAHGTKHAASETFDYNHQGQLIRHIDPDGATTRYAYNEKGERTTTAIDLNIQPHEAPDHIDDQVDRITKNRVRLAEIDLPKAPAALTVRRSITEIYTENGPY